MVMLRFSNVMNFQITKVSVLASKWNPWLGFFYLCLRNELLLFLMESET